MKVILLFFIVVVKSLLAISNFHNILAFVKSGLIAGLNIERTNSSILKTKKTK
jgi:hypothetical protein